MSNQPDDNEEHDAFTAGDVKKLADVSYRQLGDWDTKGAAPAGREKARSWRRFTPREVFVLMVCSEIRKQLGVPVDRLSYVRKFMLEEGVNHFADAVRLMRLLGQNVFIITDLKTQFSMEAEWEIKSLFDQSGFGAENQPSLLMVNVNPLINRILASGKATQRLDNHEHFRNTVMAHEDRQKTKDVKEQQILDLIRGGEFSKLEIQCRDDNKLTVRSFGKVDALTADDIARLLADRDYQTLRITMANGKIVNTMQEIARR